MNDASSESAVRVTMETASGYDSELWQQMSEMGVTGLIIGEEFGGSGVGAGDASGAGVCACACSGAPPSGIVSLFCSFSIVLS